MSFSVAPRLFEFGNAERGFRVRPEAFEGRPKLKAFCEWVIQETT